MRANKFNISLHVYKSCISFSRRKSTQPKYFPNNFLALLSVMNMSMDIKTCVRFNVNYNKL